jgi:hypothetical protein
MRVQAAGPIHVGGGTLFIADEGPPNATIEWELIGPGVLTPLSDSTDVHGYAVAMYDATGAAEGNAVQVEASAYGV